MGKFNPRIALQVVADSWPELRKCDVYRLLDPWFKADLDALVAAIRANRPDLSEEVDACLEEQGKG